MTLSRCEVDHEPPCRLSALHDGHAGRLDRLPHRADRPDPRRPRIRATHPCTAGCGYAGLMLAFWSRAEGGFDNLPNVMRLFTKPEMALAGWIHYLASDPFIGSWEVRAARSERIPFLIVLPCLLLTFLLGPAGYLTFTGLRAARAMTPLARTPSQF